MEHAMVAYPSTIAAQIVPKFKLLQLCKAVYSFSELPNLPLKYPSNGVYVSPWKRSLWI